MGNLEMAMVFEKFSQPLNLNSQSNSQYHRILTAMCNQVQLLNLYSLIIKIY